MGFYEEISKYYDYIFPAGEEQIKFLKEIAGRPPKTVLDIACGTGGYSLELSKQGYAVTACDLDSRMLEMLIAKAREQDRNIHAVQADMLKLDRQLSGRFNLAFCIGNSVVHLENILQIKEFLKNAKNLLSNDGSLVLQIINFDRILLREIKGLPTIVNKAAGLTFERLYHYDGEKNIINFKTKLNAEGKSFENVIPLYPLLQDELSEAANGAGFKKLKLFGDFNGNEFDKYNSYMLVLWAR